MTKQSGLGDMLLINGYDLSGDVQAIEKIHGGVSPLDVTPINKSGKERIGGQRDGAIDCTTFFNDAAGQAFPVLSAWPTTDIHVMYLRGTSLGSPGACLVAKQVTHDGTRAADGMLTLPTQAAGSGYGLEWGEQHTAGVRSDTGATNGTGVDGGAASSYGLQAYLQVTAFTGTDVTIKLQESSDDGAGDAYADVTGGAFAEVTSGPTYERIATAVDLSVEQYLRVITETTGGFSALSFAVVVVRNLATPTF